ncbi:MAG: isoamylase early set domain-containing protein [Limisphaerales bacterium]
MKEPRKRAHSICGLEAVFLTASVRVEFAPILPAIIPIKKNIKSIKTIAPISQALFQTAALVEDAQPHFFVPEIFKPALDFDGAGAGVSKFETIKTKSSANKTDSAKGTFDRPAPRKNGAKIGGRNNTNYSINRLATAEFYFKAPSAKSVKLAADFTDWEKYALDMIKGQDGIWFTLVPLPPGNYVYRFIVDGKWSDDPRPIKRVPNPFGTANAVINVS